MVRYYKKLDKNNELYLIGTGDGGIEITKAELERSLEEIPEEVED